MLVTGMSAISTRTQSVQSRRKLAGDVAVRAPSGQTVLDLQIQLASGLLSQLPKDPNERLVYQCEPAE